MCGVSTGEQGESGLGLRAQVAAIRADAVVVAKLDRLSRSVVDAGRLLEEARKGGFNIVALELGLDLSTPTGELVPNVLAAVAQWERRMIGQRTNEALQVKIAGGWTSPSWKARVPRAVRRRIVEMAEAGLSQRAMVDRLNADGVPAVGGRWHRGTVIRVLRQAAA
jgi:DNA invertase Pin-like site-specific DNA recombinase